MNTRAIVLGSLILMASVVGRAQEDVSLSGDVVDALTGKPMVGVTVSVAGGRERESLIAVTSSDGAFSIARVRVGGVIVVRVPGYAVYRQGVTESTSYHVVLERPAAIRGTIVSPEAARQVPAYLTAYSRNPRNRVVTFVKTTSGDFVLNDLVSGPTVLVARANGMAPDIQRVTAVAGEAVEVNFALDRGAMIRGIVRDARGRSVGGARVSVEFVGLPEEDGAILASFLSGRPITGEDGRFYIANVRPATPVRIAATAGGVTSSKSVTLVSDRESTIELILEAGTRSGDRQ